MVSENATNLSMALDSNLNLNSSSPGSDMEDSLNMKEIFEQFYSKSNPEKTFLITFNAISTPISIILHLGVIW